MPSIHSDANAQQGSIAPALEPPRDWFVLLDRVTTEIRQLLENRSIWRRMPVSASGQGPAGAVIYPATGGANEPKDVRGWLTSLYYRDAALGIRRLVDGDRRTGSFKRLLQKVAEEPRALTCEWFLGDATEERRRELDLAFKTEADTLKFGHLNPAVPRADLAALTEKTAGIKCYVDQHITHAQLDPHSAMPTPSDVDAALDLLAQLLDKYTFLLRPPRGGGLAVASEPDHSGTAVHDATAGPRG